MPIPIDGMSDAEVVEFLRVPRLAQLATLNRDGSPHLTPVWFEYVDGEFLTTIEAGTVKRFNLERDPRVAMCVAGEQTPYKAVTVYGIATLSEAGEKEALLRQAQRYLGQERGQRFFDFVKNGAGRLVRIRPERIVSWDRAKRDAAVAAS